MDIRNKLAAIAVLATVMSAGAQSLSFEGSPAPVFEEIPQSNTGLDRIYVLPSVAGVSAAYAYSGATPRWYRYSNLGGGFAEEITSGIVNADGVSTLTSLEGDMGYIIESGDRRAYFYVIDYSRHPLRLVSVEPSAEQECESTLLSLAGEGDAIHYFTINGQQRTLSRELKVSYLTLDWDDSSSSFVQTAGLKTLDYLTPSVSLTPPAYCNTTFTLSGDRFMEFWGSEESVSSSAFNPVALDVRTSAEQILSDAEKDDDYVSNVISGGDGTGLGGSAPAQIEFRAYGTDAMQHTEWQMSTDSDFEQITYRITSQDLDFTFREEGVTYVRFVGSNADGSCESYSDVYEVSIGDSDLRCPNAFSPGASPGVNDEWKVAYRSLVEFKCWIFDRYGTQMCYFDNPALGWDGRYKGKLVKPGVYYYVIQATGADGKKYKKSGDINIIRYKSSSSSSSSAD